MKRRSFLSALLSLPLAMKAAQLRVLDVAIAEEPAPKSRVVNPDYVNAPYQFSQIRFVPRNYSGSWQFHGPSDMAEYLNQK